MCPLFRKVAFNLFISKSFEISSKIFTSYLKDKLISGYYRQDEVTDAFIENIALNKPANMSSVYSMDGAAWEGVDGRHDGFVNTKQSELEWWFFTSYVEDKNFANFYHEYVVISRTRCIYSCFDDEVCIAVAYHGSRKMCYLFESFPACETSTTDIGMVTYMSPDKFVSNIAFNKPALMSSVFKNEKGCRAVDGDLSSLTRTRESTLEWWCVDLEKIYNFTSIVIYNKNSGHYMSINRLIGFQLKLNDNGECNLETFHDSVVCYKDNRTWRLYEYHLTSCNQPDVDFSSRFIFISPRSSLPVTIREVFVSATDV
ncbi:hypothetical protein LOTGIDRAFT_158858 [Lottia gigantea]|uniref:F5/8 type C domain-containing protein n=1 Tax=Lottia gigantea TaxID=225164 RepID=V4AYW3_LOTGI|nr:hypothetical protein LOTGIDRAFT_158858 [Lottia gigantea]ESO98901.1 hypothetical protein LOTGIDRAFT_158858 [Lottia gigantea]